MKSNILKYCICYLIEKEHRFVFDNCYIPFDDKKYRPLTKSQRLRKWVYNNILFYIVKDFREYLKLWHKERKTTYLRYNDYFTG